MKVPQLPDFDRRDALHLVYGLLVLPFAWLLGVQLVMRPGFETFLSAGVLGVCAIISWRLALAAGHPARHVVTCCAVLSVGVTVSPLAGAAILAGVEGMALVLRIARLDPTARRREARRLGDVAERRAGFSVAIPLVILLCFLLTLVQFRPPEPPRPEPMTILYEMTPPPEEVVEEEVVEEEAPPEIEIVETEVDPPEPQEVALAATRVYEPEPADQGEVLIQEPAEPAVEEAEPAFEIPPEPVKISDWVPTNEQMAEVVAMTRKANEQRQELDRQKKEIRESIIRAEVDSAARDFILDSDGGTQGAIRMLNLDGYPPHVLNPLLRRYGITYERTQLAPGAGRSFLNAAVTEQGTFNNRASGPGLYDVMVLSNKAIHMMSTRETEALLDRGYDPRRTRVLEIVFGVVLNDNGQYDFGVTSLKVEQVR